MDVLPLFTTLSKTFQAGNLNLDKVETMLSVTRETLSTMLVNPATMETTSRLLQIPRDNDNIITWKGVKVKKTDADEHSFGSIKSLFINELLAQLDRRFPPEAMSLLSDLNTVLNNKKIKSIA